MSDERKISTTAIEDIEFAAYSAQGAAEEALEALERAKTELCIAVGAPGYSWTTAIPHQALSAIGEAEGLLRKVAFEAGCIPRELRAETEA